MTRRRPPPRLAAFRGPLTALVLSLALGWTVAPSASAASPAPATGEVYGFLPYWSMDGGIDAYLAGAELSTIGLFSVGATASGDLDTSAPGYRAITGTPGRRIVADAHAAGRRVEPVFTSFGTEANAAFFGDPARQARAVEALGELVGTLGVDGLDLDVEALDPTWIGTYGSFAGAVRARLSAIDPTLTLSVATTANFTGALMAGAAIAQGASDVRLIFSDILPNVVSQVIVLLPLMIATTILTESALSFLSIGVQPPNASWGTIINDGQDLLYTRPWVAIAPGIMIVLTVLALNVLGDGVRDALDPRAKLRVEA